MEAHSPSNPGSKRVVPSLRTIALLELPGRELRAFHFFTQGPLRNRQRMIDIPQSGSGRLRPCAKCRKGVALDEEAQQQVEIRKCGQIVPVEGRVELFGKSLGVVD